MRKPALQKIIVIAFCLTAMLSVLVTSGCTKDTATVPQTLDELSLVNIWEGVASSIDLQEQGAEFDSLYLHSDRDRKVDTLYFTFEGYTEKGRAHVYTASMNSKDEINIRTNEIASIQPTQHPLKIFEQIDRLGMASLKTGDEGLSLQIGFQQGDIGYSYDNLDIYHLDNGTLLPLKEIIFHSSYPWCTVSVYELVPNETIITRDGHTIAQATTVSAPVPPDERTSQIWFLGDDINKATTIEYMESKLETE
jgi:hypothetical protein